jgi:hypothetical protein
MLKHVTFSAEPPDIKTMLVSSVMMAMGYALDTTLRTLIGPNDFTFAYCLVERIAGLAAFRMSLLREFVALICIIALGFILPVLFGMETMKFSQRFSKMCGILTISSTPFFKVSRAMQSFPSLGIRSNFIGMFFAPFSLVFGSV